MTPPSFSYRLMGENGRLIGRLLVYGDAKDAYELLRQCQTDLDSVVRSEARRLAIREGEG